MKKMLDEKTIARIVADAISNENYEKAIKKLEPHIASLPSKRKYSIALLYDHAAGRIKEGSRQKKYITNAEKIYRDLIQEYPHSILPFLGMGRVYGLRDDFSKALLFQKRAFTNMAKLPKSERGALGIGHIYEEMEKPKIAELWYLKEYKFCNDFGTTLNLFRFYLRQKNIQRAKRYGLKLKPLLQAEFKKPQYKGHHMLSSKFVMDIKKDIRFIEKA
jgi:tetratricopeptide (TPR) repeat protein